MAQPPSDRAAVNPTATALAGAASVHVAHVAVRMSGDSAPNKDDGRTPKRRKSDASEHAPRAAHDQKDKQKVGGGGDAEAFSSDVILVTSEDLRLFEDGDGAGSDDDSSGRVHIPAIEFN